MVAHHFRYLDGNTGYFIWLATIVLIKVHYCIFYQDVLLVACLKNMSRVNLLLSVSQLTWNRNDFGYDYSQRSFRTLHLFYCILGLLGIQLEELMCVLFESTFQVDRIKCYYYAKTRINYCSFLLWIVCKWSREVTN